MNQFIFSIYDVVGDVYFPLLVFSSLGDAFRSFRSYVEDPKSPVYAYPSDYKLTSVGRFSSTGEFFPSCEFAPDVAYSDDDIYFSLSFSDIKWCLSYITKAYNVDSVNITTSMIKDAIINFERYHSNEVSSDVIENN